MDKTQALGMARKQKKKPQQQRNRMTSRTQPVLTQETKTDTSTSQDSPELKPSINERSSYHSIYFATLVAILGLIPPYVGIVFQWYQIADLQKGAAAQASDFANQMEALRSTIAKNRDLEIAPRLVVECPIERFEMTPGKTEELMNDAKLRIKNIGRGTAFNVFAEVMFVELRLDQQTVVEKEWIQKFAKQRPISAKVIPPGQSLPFTEFDFPLFDTTQPQGLKGAIGFYCKNEDGKEVF